LVVTTTSFHSCQAAFCVLDLILPGQEDLEDFLGQDSVAAALVLVEWAADLVDFSENPRNRTHRPLSYLNPQNIMVHVVLN
jgi:hypothetical protein